MPTPEVDGTISLDARQTYQEMAGFGASGAWWAQDIGGWEDEKRERIVRLLFDQQEGIGLSVYRYNIGGGAGQNIADPWRRAETFEIEQGIYDWNRDANAVWVLKAAQAAGVEKFIAFANSPPARITVSGLTTGEKDGNSNLRPDMVDQYAQYLVDIVRYLREEEGIPIGWISPINEPQWNWSYKNGQEGSHYTVEEVVTVTKAVLQAIETNGLAGVEVSVFDSGEWKNSQVYIRALLDDPEIAPALHHLAIHSYWSDRNDKEQVVRFMANHYPGVELWMSEWTEMQEGRDYGMDSALVLANTIHEDLTIANVTSWQYWIAVSYYHYRDGLIYVNLIDREIEETKRLWAMGNFSRFIQPNFVRVAAETNAAGVNVVAFQSPDRAQTVLVVINNNETAQVLALDWGNTAVSHITHYETSETHDLALIYEGKPTAQITFSAHSVTTIIQP